VNIHPGKHCIWICPHNHPRINTTP